jgi:hypothetical protein
LTKASGLVTIDIVSPSPDGPHQLLESTDLKTWQTGAAAVLTNMANNIVRVSINYKSALR